MDAIEPSLTPRLPGELASPRLPAAPRRDPSPPGPSAPSSPPRSGVVPATTPPPRPKARREKTILLGMLGTLAGAFVGVLSMKLLVPRPPAGTGPDVHLEQGVHNGFDLVEPPALTTAGPPQPSPHDPFRGATPPAAAPPDDQAAGAERFPRSRFAAETTPLAADQATTGRFGAPPTDDGLLVAPPPDLQPVPVEAAPRRAATAATTPGGAGNPLRRGPVAPPPAEREGAAAAFLPPNAGFAAAAGGSAVLPASAEVPPNPRGPGAENAAESYVVQNGDSWWSIAEGTYGDGRMYKALFAWNRAIDPRVSLAPGTPLELPAEPRLRAAWGRLIPVDSPPQAR
ncbi:MAG: LysM peptidoglycan-binding domain-containing protein [Planctomycetota bacterium]|nr:MAG: LysM peptidoglycan-binding domain-containing protein [Planctomycetota bacterium]